MGQTKTAREGPMSGKVKAEKLQRQIKEVEKEWRELEEAELKRLERVKRQLEEEKRAKQQHADRATARVGEGSGAEVSGASGVAT